MLVFFTEKLMILPLHFLPKRLRERVRLDMSPCSVICLPYLWTLLMVSFGEQKLFIFMQSYLSLILYFCHLKKCMLIQALQDMLLLETVLFHFSYLDPQSTWIGFCVSYEVGEGGHFIFSWTHICVQCLLEKHTVFFELLCSAAFVIRQ